MNPTAKLLHARLLTGTKVSSRFIIKDKTKIENQSDLVYLCNYPKTNCTDNYIGETAKRISQRFIDQHSRDKVFQTF